MKNQAKVEDKIRKPVAPPSQAFPSKKAYTRKQKHQRKEEERE
jgi:hypothetical protein